jgi:peptidyl-prolyl cis-trans isomerase D
VNGEDIDATDFSNKVKETEEQYGSHANGMFFQIRQNVWDQVVQESVLNSEFEKLGLTFSPKELSAIMFSDDAPPALKQSFTDKATGQYDIAKAQDWWRTQAKKAKGEQRDKIEEAVIDPLVLRGLYTKYNALISAGAYYPTWMQEKEIANNKTFANISYVSVPYSVINDSAVKVSDDDITDYVKNHAANYKQDGGRVLSYVSFSTNPSSQDTAKTLEAVASLKSNFISDTNAKKFVINNLSAENFDDHYIYKSKLTMPQKDSVAALPVGGVFGPYLDGKNIVLAKMLVSRELPDSVKCRHILIKIADQKGEIRADSTARKLIDSIATAIKGGADFNAMVLKYSDDEGSKNTKGEYTFGNSSQLVDSFYRTVFYEPVGTKKIVKGESLQGEGAYIGYHYIEVLSQWKMEPAYQIAFMSKEIVASDETVNSAQSQATKLSGEATDAKSMDAYVAKNNLKKINVPTVIKENDFQLGSLQDARQVIKWAFDAKEGNVSEPFSIGDQFVVAIVNKVVPEGLPDAATARPLVENEIRKQKKADQISAKIGNAPTLETAAAAYGNPVQTAGADSSLTFNSPIINGVGQEPKVIGSAFNKDYQSKVSPAIAGTNGVYVIKVNSIGTKPADAVDVVAKQNADHEKGMLQQASSGWFASLKKIADIKDNRSKFY